VHVSRVVLLVAVLLLVACAAPGSGAADDIRGEWQLVEGTADGVPLPQPAGAQATLVFEDGQLSGRSFCNHYGSTYRIDGTSLELDGLGGTEIGCEPEIAEAESAYLAALGAVDTVAVEGDVLTLTGPDVSLTFRPVPPVPTSEPAGTRWVLDTLIDGETASSTLGEGFLLLDPDGTAEASTGCRTITGRWLVEEGRLVIDDLIATGECAPDVARQDAHVTAVLESGPALEIEENRLTLTAPDGRGVLYRG
jgi:heat shock protein HslJ